MHFNCTKRSPRFEGHRAFNAHTNRLIVSFGSFFGRSNEDGFQNPPHTLLFLAAYSNIYHYRCRLNLPTATTPLAQTTHAFINHGDTLLSFLLLHLLAHPLTRPHTQRILAL